LRCPDEIVNKLGAFTQDLIDDKVNGTVTNDDLSLTWDNKTAVSGGLKNFDVGASDKKLFYLTSLSLFRFRQQSTSTTVFGGTL